MLHIPFHQKYESARVKQVTPADETPFDVQRAKTLNLTSKLPAAITNVLDYPSCKNFPMMLLHHQKSTWQQQQHQQHQQQQQQQQHQHQQQKTPELQTLEPQHTAADTSALV
ncbi:hypothetical protein FHG87_004726 [Trinorchestia longiramus]|nr:hypothetical protein FHG87_004726 [Trinorchestia longiramus]